MPVVTLAPRGQGRTSDGPGCDDGQAAAATTLLRPGDNDGGLRRTCQGLSRLVLVVKSAPRGMDGREDVNGGMGRESAWTTPWSRGCVADGGGSCPHGRVVVWTCFAAVAATGEARNDNDARETGNAMVFPPWLAGLIPFPKYVVFTHFVDILVLK